MKRYGNLKVDVIDRCPSYLAAMKVIGNENYYEIGRYLNNRVENSQLSLRRASGICLDFN